MDVVDEISNLLQTYGNRDKVVSLTSYILKLWGATSKRQNLLTASAKLASARAALRLFDDAAVLKNFINYGLGKQDGPFWGSLGVSNGLFTLAYLQAEKLVFLLDSGVLVLDEEKAYKVRTAHKLFWSLYAFIGFIRSIRALQISARELKRPNKPKCAQARFTQASLTTTKLLLDVIHAVSWLPRGWLWGGSLQTTQAAGIATLSAVLGLVIHYNGKRLLPR
ncbi:peroxisomal membrane protein 11C-like [Melitaea cinxia]|uniref:peroxisomal membrane protein 11C-like n=1 Tax=Melitaea cinxia TaxID=113334 RepID=UPI001E271CBF|nr:peroxisomal membrane protein 11C-like [Melitaea cinxia]